MNLLKIAKDQEFQSVRVKSLMKNVKVLEQVGTSNKKRDQMRKALAPGKRISKTGKIYWETRSNRSDQVGSKL